MFELFLLLQLYLQLFLAIHLLEILHLHLQHPEIFTHHPILLLRHFVKIALDQLTLQVIVHLQQHIHIFLQLSVLLHQSLAFLLIGGHQLLAPRLLIGRHLDTTVLCPHRSLYFPRLRVLQLQFQLFQQVERLINPTFLHPFNKNSKE